LKNLIKQMAAHLPPVKRLLSYRTLWAPGHYYSPIPDHQHGLNTTANQEGKFHSINGIDLNDEEQLELFKELTQYMKGSTFRNEEKVPDHRFYNNNGIYSYSDPLYLESMIRHLRPTRIIEVGSGHTSALMLDINDKYFGSSIDLTFVEPYPERLFTVLSEQDKKNVTLRITGLQSIEKDVFTKLQPNDILLIDSTHVAKTGSDLLYLFYEILPILNKGVYIHFHDIFNNFEYLPYHFNSFNGFGWNECYFLRAFLMYNPHFKIVLFSNYLDNRYKDRLLSIMPEYPVLKGAQIWLKKI